MNDLTKLILSFLLVAVAMILGIGFWGIVTYGLWNFLIASAFVVKPLTWFQCFAVAAVIVVLHLLLKQSKSE